jgi:GNAT superfamily N-acetyltransferase
VERRAEDGFPGHAIPGAARRLPDRGDEGVGRLYIDRWTNEHCIIDIAFLAEHRGKGLGEALLRDLMDEASAAGKAVMIYVEKFNPAMRLYHRLGFKTDEDKGVYDLMRWTPGDIPAGEPGRRGDEG